MTIEDGKYRFATAARGLVALQRRCNARPALRHLQTRRERSTVGGIHSAHATRSSRRKHPESALHQETARRTAQDAKSASAGAVGWIRLGASPFPHRTPGSTQLPRVAECRASWHLASSPQFNRPVHGLGSRYFRLLHSASSTAALRILSSLVRFPMSSFLSSRPASV